MRILEEVIEFLRLVLLPVLALEGDAPVVILDFGIRIGRGGVGSVLANPRVILNLADGFVADVAFKLLRELLGDAPNCFRTARKRIETSPHLE